MSERLTFSRTLPLAKKNGLVFIRATTASAVASIDITNCFSSAYRNYLILGRHTASTAGSGYCTFQYLVGSTATTANYFDRTAQFYAAALGWELLDNGAGTDECIASVFSGSSAPQNELAGFALTLYGPNIAKPTAHSTTGLATFTANRYHQTSSGGQTDNTAFDGIKFIFPGASHSAQIDIYGYSI